MGTFTSPKLIEPVQIALATMHLPRPSAGTDLPARRRVRACPAPGAGSGAGVWLSRVLVNLATVVRDGEPFDYDDVDE